LKFRRILSDFSMSIRGGFGFEVDSRWIRSSNKNVFFNCYCSKNYVFRLSGNEVEFSPEFHVEEVPKFHFISTWLKTRFYVQNLSFSRSLVGETYFFALFFNFDFFKFSTCFHHVDIESRWIPPRLYYWLC
jgi:hypothetical protein